MRVYKARRAPAPSEEEQIIRPSNRCRLRAQQFVPRAAARAAQVNGTIPPCGHASPPKEQALYKIIAGVLGQQADRAGPRGGLLVWARITERTCARVSGWTTSGRLIT